MRSWSSVKCATRLWSLVGPCSCLNLAKYLRCCFFCCFLPCLLLLIGYLFVTWNEALEVSYSNFEKSSPSRLSRTPGQGHQGNGDLTAQAGELWHFWGLRKLTDIEHLKLLRNWSKSVGGGGREQRGDASRGGSFNFQLQWNPTLRPPR